MVATPQFTSLKLTDFSDVEFLHLLIDAQDDDGWTDSAHLAAMPELKWLEDIYKYPRNPISSRLVWLWKYGVVEREHKRDPKGNLLYISDDQNRPKWGQRWKLTALGEAMVTGTLTERQKASLDKLEATSMLDVTRWLTDQTREAPNAARKLMEREWRYGLNQNGRVA